MQQPHFFAEIILQIQQQAHTKRAMLHSTIRESESSRSSLSSTNIRSHFLQICCTFPVAKKKRNTDVSMRSDKSGHRRSHIKPVTRCHLGHIPTNNTHLKHVWWVAHCHLTHVWTLPKTQHARNIAETLRSIGKDCAMMLSVMRSRPEWTGDLKQHWKVCQA